MHSILRVIEAQAAMIFIWIFIIQMKWLFCFAVCWQGVTLTDLKEAEKTVPKAADPPLRNIQPVSPIVTVTPAERGKWGWNQMSQKQYLVKSQEGKQSSNDHKCSTANHKSVLVMFGLPVTSCGWRPTSVYHKTRWHNKKTWYVDFGWSGLQESLERKWGFLIWALRATAAADVVLGVSYLPRWLSCTHFLRCVCL